MVQENLDLETRALQKAHKDLKTSQNEENFTSSRIFNENSWLSSELEEVKRKTRDLIEERDMSATIWESKLMYLFKNGLKEVRSEVLNIFQEKVNKARYYMEGFVETFHVTSLFGKAHAVAETLHSIFCK